LYNGITNSKFYFRGVGGNAALNTNGSFFLQRDGDTKATVQSAGFAIGKANDITPASDATYDLGSTSLRWANGYFDQLDQEIHTATDVGHILKGAASQSADLAQYQNSAGTVMTRIESDGSINASGNITATGSIAVGGQTGGAILEADAANTLAQRNGTNAQAFNIYNTYSDASNYERLKIGWYGNDAIIGTEKAGTGSARTLQFQIAGTNKLEITGTWIDLRGSCRPDTNGTRHFGYSY
jgi:hypothetical protein